MLIVIAVACLSMLLGGIFLYYYRERKCKYAEHGLDIALGIVGFCFLVIVGFVSIGVTSRLVGRSSLDERIAISEEYAEALHQSNCTSSYAYYAEQDYTEELKKIRKLKEQRAKEDEYRWWLYFGGSDE